jgi:hypothetical protein
LGWKPWAQATSGSADAHEIDNTAARAPPILLLAVWEQEFHPYSRFGVPTKVGGGNASGRRQRND